ncbi:hypothetical protein E4P42_22690 [Mycobacterium sp. PS03-16]|uniref:hypothetical protein n=1 Tax=Mycobacterium sp. PS03-16 TaxID=2559611 RepID=UPI001073D29B|nr:hypothetical protein [Mycobacterium sp. PS03-16]TFV55437.1 hypothetical protein E4P42_22690 [Mycobacterium sp. PS03-16]
MAVFVRKLLRIGRLPDEMRAAAEAEGILHLAEYVPVTRRFSGSIPGKRATGSVSGYTGALVLTRQRVLGTLSTVPGLAGRTIDQSWTEAQDGPVRAEVSADGLHIEADLADIDARCHGTVSLHYRGDVPDDVLAALPTRSLAYTVPPEWVFRAVGVPYRP